MTDIAIIRQTSVQITPAEMQATIDEINRALRQEIYAYWGTWATVWINAPPPGSWQVILQDTLDQPGDLGYHVDTTGLPTARIAVPFCIEYKDDWRTCVAHEIFEMVVNPTAAAMVGPYLKEICDPVVGQQYRDWVPNFVTPAYFGLGTHNPPYDYMQLLHGSVPTAAQPNGYLEYKKSDGSWSSYRPLREGYMSSRTTGRRAWGRDNAA